ncbi:cytochrome P450 4X1-like [Sus scrofa]|uniref:Cytochrome P450 4X1 isoform 1 n=1 Tax=Sus scrofa TaxID=9823 RepID=A0A481A010_PIG|nr:cytochrome P450 4X1-like [Sus scrofa]XP_020952361.1 cytochrome P450 4X1-like [Sus scrofa]
MESSWLETHWARPLHLALVFCLALGLLQAVKLYLQRQRLLRDLRPFPSPPSHWFYGHQKIIQNGGMETLGEITDKYPRAFPFWLGPFQAFFFIYDPDYAKTLLSRPDPKSNFLYKFMDPVVGKGLLNLNGPKWFQHRRLLTPGLHLNALKSHVEIMAHSVNTMLGKWERICGTEDTLLEISAHVTLLTLDIIMKCVFGLETNCQINSTYDHYVKAVNEGSNLIFYRVYNFLYHHDIIFKFSPKGHRFLELRKILHPYTAKIIQAGKNSLMNENQQGNTQKRKYRNIFDIALSAQAENGDSFSDTDLRSEVNTFLLAGHETMTGGLTWLLYHLALYPEHQERCREEIRSILGDGSSITWGQLGEMSYTTMCIKESLRLAPPVLSFSRELSKPITFSDGRSLPAGITVVCSIWGLHHNPAIWENPQVFDPLRFSQENNDKRHCYAYLPFSAGPRNCVGQQFAMAELKAAVALILLRFSLTAEPTRPLVSRPNIFLKPKNGLYLHLKKLP